MPRTFLIDTDTASDDAVALIMALRHPDVRVAAITVVAGNVPLEQGTQNALYTVDLCGADVPVYCGAPKPALRVLNHARWFHGHDGMGDQNYPPARSRPRAEHAVDAIVAIVAANPGLTLVTLGPLTNVALALAREPSIVKNIGRCVMMGGNPCCEGNVTPAAEFNIWVDPEAARMVLLSGLPIELVGWQLARGDAKLSPDEVGGIRSLDTALAHFAVDCNRTAIEAHHTQTSETGLALCDPVAMAVALDPSVCTGSSVHRVEVESSSELTRGMTVVDRLNVSGDERNRALWRQAPSAAAIRVCWSIDAALWKRMLYAALG